LWNGSYVTGILLGDILLFAFLGTLFVLDYAVASRNEFQSQDTTVELAPATAVMITVR
jgi:hypothetical protein